METPIQSNQFVSTMKNPADSLIMSMADMDPFKYNGMDEDEVDEIARLRRDGRNARDGKFRREYFYGRSRDNLTCIWNNNKHSWSVDSSGITWVGVHGKDSICVVTEAEELDVTRVHGGLLFRTKEKVLREFRRTVISEIEDLADPLCSKPYLGKSIKAPFGVVSVVPLSDKVHKASSDEYQESICTKFELEYFTGQASIDEEVELVENDNDSFIKYLVRANLMGKNSLLSMSESRKRETIKYLQDELERKASTPINELTMQESIDEEMAIEFLEKKMKKSIEHFTLDETAQTAIAAFQHLLKKNFKASEIGVSIMHPNYCVYCEEAGFKDIYVKHLVTSEIELILADMNEPGSGGSSSSGSSSSRGSRNNSEGSDNYF